MCKKMICLISFVFVLATVGISISANAGTVTGTEDDWTETQDITAEATNGDWRLWDREVGAPTYEKNTTVDAIGELEQVGEWSVQSQDWPNQLFAWSDGVNPPTTTGTLVGVFSNEGITADMGYEVDVVLPGGSGEITVWAGARYAQCTLTVLEGSTPLFTLEGDQVTNIWGLDRFDLEYSGFSGSEVLTIRWVATTPAGSARALFYGVAISSAGPATKASLPNPGDDETDVPRDVVLSWMPGIYAAKHDFYFDTDFNDVNETNIPGLMYYDVNRIENYYPTVGTLDLDLGQTYYWRVDEVNDACAPGLWEGSVWQFTTEPISYQLPSDRIDVNASSEYDAARAAVNTINESGLDVNDEHSIVNSDMWLSASSPLGAWIEYAFDEVYKLHEMWVWNFNDEFNHSFGCKDVNVEYSTNGTDWTSLGVYEFAEATGEPNYTHNTTVDMSGVVAQYVRLTATSTWGIGNLYGLSEVRFYYMPMRARDPDPASGLTDVPIDATLSFRAGREAAQHDIYLSEDEQAVIDETADVCSIAASGSYGSYTPSPSLSLGKTYYWKVNEVNMNETPSTWESDVWQFSTPEYLIIENMDSYVGRDGIIAVWKDGYATFENGSNVTLSTVIDPRYPAGHQAPGPIHEGSNAMQFVYDNDKNIWIYVPEYDPYSYSVFYYFSEAEANTVDLECVSDWTTADVELLSIYFSGDPDNDIGPYEQMYIALKDGEGDIAVVKYGDSVGEDANNLKSREWTEWAIELEEFETVNTNFNLENVEKIYIGFGERFNNTNAGGSGVVYFDSIRLYTPKCVPAAVVDLTGDCTIDMEDFIIMANSWNGKQSTAVPIIDLKASNFSAGPPASWPNTDGTLGGKFDVNSFDINDNPSSGMVDGLLAVTFDGNDYLIANFSAPGSITGANDFTVITKIFNPAVAVEEMILTWARRGGPAYTTGAVGYGTDPAWGAVIHWNAGNDTPDMGFDGGVPAADMWHEIAASYDGVTERVLVDGKLNAIENKTLNIYADDPVTVGAGYDWDFNDVNDPNDDFLIMTLYLSSSVNRIRVYDEGMAQHQLEYIMTGSYSADLDGDGDVDFKDLAMLLDDWLKERLFP